MKGLWANSRTTTPLSSLLGRLPPLPLLCTLSVFSLCVCVYSLCLLSLIYLLSLSLSRVSSLSLSSHLFSLCLLSLSSSLSHSLYVLLSLSLSCVSSLFLFSLFILSGFSLLLAIFTLAPLELLRHRSLPSCPGSSKGECSLCVYTSA